jgi:hypothetical protein
VVELLRDVFDYRISLGTVHNIVHSAVPLAGRINQQYDLSAILNALLDEIFQANKPVLVGVDARSTFCFLLSQEEHRDADTWGVRLLELVDRGFAPKATVADFGAGLRAGQKEALPKVPCRGDVFHALYTIGPLARYLENRAYEAIDARSKLKRKQATAERRHGRKDMQRGRCQPRHRTCLWAYLVSTAYELMARICLPRLPTCSLCVACVRQEKSG